MADKRIFDMDMLLQSTCDDKELAGQVVAVFLADIPVQIADLDAALIAGDAKTAERVAHSIKGAAATVGGEALREVALACEQCGREGRLDEVRSEMAELKTRYAALESELRANGFTEA